MLANLITRTRKRKCLLRLLSKNLNVKQDKIENGLTGMYNLNRFIYVSIFSTFIHRKFLPFGLSTIFHKSAFQLSDISPVISKDRIFTASSTRYWRK